jgi:ankyrin repeat protein
MLTGIFKMKRIITIVIFIIIGLCLAIQIIRFYNLKKTAKNLTDLIDDGDILGLVNIVCNNKELKNSKIPSTGDTILNYAIENKKFNIAKMLIKCGVDSNLKGYSNRTALHVAVENNMIAVVKILLKAGADIEAKGYRHNYTPLHMAATRGFVKIGSMLINSGANIESRNMQGETPLICAIDMKNIKMIKLLLESGANINIADQRGRTAKSIAQKSNIDLETLQRLD